MFSQIISVKLTLWQKTTGIEISSPFMLATQRMDNRKMHPSHSFKKQQEIIQLHCYCILLQFKCISRLDDSCFFCSPQWTRSITWLLQPLHPTTCITPSKPSRPTPLALLTCLVSKLMLLFSWSSYSIKVGLFWKTKLMSPSCLFVFFCQKHHLNLITLIQLLY